MTSEQYASMMYYIGIIQGMAMLQTGEKKEEFVRMLVGLNNLVEQIRKENQ